MHQGDEALLTEIRQLWSGTLMLNRPNRPREHIGDDIASGLVDLESYGRMVLVNPDLVTRLQTQAPLNEADRNTFFGGSEWGYTDYPILTATT